MSNVPPADPARQEQRLVRQRGGELAGNVIVQASELADAIHELSQRANVLTPIVQISSLAAHHAVNLCVVQIDPTVDGNGNGPMCYRDKMFMSENERGLNKIGLDMIAAAAGISWLPYPHSRRTDDGNTRHLWRYTVTGAYTAMDGSVQTLPPGSSEVDLRDGSEQIGGWSPAKWAQAIRNEQKTVGGWSEKRVMQARRFGEALAETKARLRAIRSLGIRQKFTIEDLRRPFIVPRVSYVPDMTNPEVARVVTERKMGGIAALFAGTPATPMMPGEPGAAASSLPPVDYGDEPSGGILGPGPKRVTSATGPKAANYTVLKVFRTNRQGKPPLFWILTKESGEEKLFTEDETIAQSAKEAAQKGLPVDSTFSRREEVVDGEPFSARYIEEIVVMPLEPAGGDGDEGGKATVARFVVDIQTKTGVGKPKGDQPGKPWTKYTIVFSTGESGVTFSEKFAKDAAASKADKIPVDVTLESSERYPDQMDLTNLTLVDGKQATLPMTEEL